MTYTEIIDSVQQDMHKFDTGSPERIQHFTKVHSFATQIGKQEKLDDETQFILELTALLHDIGIKVAEEKHGFSNGKLQEELGPDVARELLSHYEIKEEVVDRVCYLIANHHTYTNIEGLEYRILVEADFLVNLYENSVDEKGILSVYNKMFVTDAGRAMCKVMFNIS